MRYWTAGESHGKGILAFLDGFPAGLRVDQGLIDSELRRRQGGYGRGGRQSIEEDRAELLTGIWRGETTGAPIAIWVNNRDYKIDEMPDIYYPRPGHADLAGSQKFRSPIRPILERSSARETAGRVAAGALARQLLQQFNIQIVGFVRSLDTLELIGTTQTVKRIGPGQSKKCNGPIDKDEVTKQNCLVDKDNSVNKGVSVDRVCSVNSVNNDSSVDKNEMTEPNCRVEKGQLSDWDRLTPDELVFRRNQSVIYSLQPDRDEEARQLIDEYGREGDTLGGIVEIRAYNIPVGLGSHTQWDEKLDGRLAQAVLSVQAIKGVEFGLGFETARLPGSSVHDPIGFESEHGFVRPSNNAGGIEGGMSNGMPIIIRAAMKPIPTLRRPLPSVHLQTKEPKPAEYERSDVCAVPAASVVLENVVALELTRAFLAKFSGDSLAEVRERFDLTPKF
ncbi:MAG: chorismate synthase [Thermoguttaceae bacterium]